MAMTRPSYETLRGESFPTVRQISIFTDNRLGQLLRIAQLIEQKEVNQKEVRILALSVVDSVDCAVVRLLFNAPDEALHILREAGFPVSVTEVLVVELPPGKRGLMSIWSALLSSEINIAFAYPLFGGKGISAIALHVDNIEVATNTLKDGGYRILGETDLEQDM